MSKKNLYKDIVSGFKFDFVDFLVEDDVRKEVEVISAYVDNVIKWIVEQKEKFIEEKGRGQDWGDFVVYCSKELERVVD